MSAGASVVPPTSRPTLERVAARAGVSRATASRAPRGSNNVSAPALEAVLRAADELAYTVISFRVFLSIVVPAARPAMAVLGMLTFLTTWNDFFWPIIALNSQNPTVQVAFQSLATGYAPQQSVIMAGTLYGIFPVLVVFTGLGKDIVGAIMQGAIKG